MSAEELSGKLEAIYEDLVVADFSDLQALAQVHERVQGLDASVAEVMGSACVEASRALSDLVEGVILGERDQPDGGKEVALNTLTLLLQVASGDAKESALAFPPELFSDVRATETDSDGDTAEKVPAYTLPAHVDEEIFTEFLARQPEVQANLEKSILDLENEDEADAYEVLRRILHTLKGEAGLLGLTEVEQLCHAVEDVLSESNCAEKSDDLLEIKDWLDRVFAFYQGAGPAPVVAAQMMKDLAAKASSGVNAAATQESKAPASASPELSFLESDPDLLHDFVLEAREHLENADVQLLKLEAEPSDEEAINCVFRSFHTIKGTSGFLALEQIQALAHESENLLDRARKGLCTLDNVVMDVCFDSVDTLKKLVHAVSESLSSGNSLERVENVDALVTRIVACVAGSEKDDSEEKPKKQVGRILVESGKASTEQVEVALEKQQELKSEGTQKKIGEILMDDGEVKPKDVAQALRNQQRVSRRIKEPVKVDSERLDYLVDTIGEMVIAESMVTQSPGLRKNAEPDVLRHLNQLDKITHELQEIATSLRMVPVRATFQKMARLVRDLGRKSNKQVKLVLQGEDTELDKSVVDRIGDPLVHMIRNAVDHGLESDVQERRDAGKEDEGKVELRAFHKAGCIHIEIEDDGRGLDRDAILAKARSRGVIGDTEELADRDVWNLIFEPGFSTAKTVTEVSGRGVGMDVVRRGIEALRGHVEIQSCEGRGTVFSIRLPLTLAIIDGMVLRVGNERYILPTLSMTQSLRPRPEDLSTVVGRGKLLSLHGDLLPLFHLADLFSLRGDAGDALSGIVVIVEYDGRRAALVVDELLGQQQTVIKSLGSALQGISGISGGAIMPDGRVGLIIDVGGLIELAHSNSEQEDGLEAPAERELVPA